MALVGPRPEVPRFVDLQDPLWIATLSVRPGITDLATLVYRDEETVLAGAENVEEFYRRHVLPDKLRLNSDYLQFRTWRTDLRILFLTALGSLFPATCDPQRIRKQFPSVSPSSRVTQIS
jgi:lipopolysaccharide/colanic/teichoic acid biosynthesis glycosyltransferase